MTIRDGSCTVFRMATIHMEVLVSVHGLDMQVSPNQAVLQVDPCVKEGYLFSGPSGSKFDGRVVTVEAVDEDSFAMGPYGKDVLSVYLHHAQDILSWVHRNSHSNFPMTD